MAGEKSQEVSTTCHCRVDIKLAHEDTSCPHLGWEHAALTPPLAKPVALLLHAVLMPLVDLKTGLLML